MAQLVRRFTKEIRTVAERDSVTVRRLALGRNAVELDAPGVSGLLTIHESNLDKGFWGISGNVLTGFRATRSRWAVVLLHMTHSRGLVIPDIVTEELIRNGVWTTQEKSGIHYKVNPPHGVTGAVRFVSVEEALDRVRTLWT